MSIEDEMKREDIAGLHLEHGDRKMWWSSPATG